MHKVRSYVRSGDTCIKLGHMSGLGNVHKVRSYDRSGQRA